MLNVIKQMGSGAPEVFYSVEERLKIVLKFQYRACLCMVSFALSLAGVFSTSTHPLCSFPGSGLAEEGIVSLCVTLRSWRVLFCVSLILTFVRSLFVWSTDVLFCVLC